MSNKINLKDFTNSLLKKQINDYGEAGKKAMKEIRDTIVDQWFGGYSSVSMKSATSYYKYTYMIDACNSKIIIKSWVDVEKYNPNQRIQTWNKQNGYGLDPSFLMEYVLNLQLEEGIIGLPEKETMTGTGWENNKFKKKDPLRQYIENNVLWSEWENYVNKYI